MANNKSNSFFSSFSSGSKKSAGSKGGKSSCRGLQCASEQTRKRVASTGGEAQHSCRGRGCE